MPNPDPRTVADAFARAYCDADPNADPFHGPGAHAYAKSYVRAYRNAYDAACAVLYPDSEPEPVTYPDDGPVTNSNGYVDPYGPPSR